MAQDRREQALRIGALLADGAPRDLEAIAAALELPSPEPVFLNLRYLCANARGYTAEGDWGQPATLRFRRS